MSPERSPIQAGEERPRVSHVRAPRGCCLWHFGHEIYLTVAFYACELCAHKRHENAHTLNNCKLKSSLARSNLIFWQLPLQM